MAGDITEKVLDDLNAKRLQRQALSATHEKAMRESCPELKAIDAQIARCSLSDKPALPGLLKKRESTVSKWLKSNGHPDTWLIPAQDCTICGDTGYTQGKLCTCVRNETARRLFDEAGLTKNSPSFDKFDLSVFSGSERVSGGRTVREFMETMREGGISYSDNFPDVQIPNMLFTGKPGRGKTFLMDCIASRVISRGFWVVRATAFGVNDVMAKALFDRADPESLFACDLLALDDLGSEPILNKVTISSMFSLLNERAAKGRPFIVSTNLTPEEILKRYGDRVFSRIADARTTRVIEFEGEDLRRGKTNS
jgi:DNA replication protein DnaC